MTKKNPTIITKQENTPLLRFTKKRSLSIAEDKAQVQSIKRGRFSSSFSSEETKTGNESNISSYTSLIFYILSAQPVSSHLTDLEGDINDKTNFIDERFRIVVIYEQQK